MFNIGSQTIKSFTMDEIKSDNIFISGDILILKVDFAVVELDLI